MSFSLGDFAYAGLTLALLLASEIDSHPTDTDSAGCQLDALES